MNRFPISRVDHVRALPDRRLVVRARCPMCGRPQLELPIHESTRCRDCGVALRYVSNHLVPKRSPDRSEATRSGNGIHPPAVGDGQAATTAAAAEKPVPRESAEQGARKGSTASGEPTTTDPAAAELDWVFAVAQDDADRENGVEIPERLTEATHAQFARTIA